MTKWYKLQKYKNGVKSYIATKKDDGIFVFMGDPKCVQVLPKHCFSDVM